MYAKYRIFLRTSQGIYFMGAVNSVNDIIEAGRHFLNSAIGRGIYDDQIESIILMRLDEKNGSYIREDEVPVSSRVDISKRLHDMGAR